MTPAEAIAQGAIGAMLQTGQLLRDLTVRELIDMMASLYPNPMDVDDVLELTGVERHRRSAHAETLRRADTTHQGRDRAGI